mgnify:CR=1 FL=1
MRIQMSYGGYTPDACCVFKYGEVEDYTLNVYSSAYREALELNTNEKTIDVTEKIRSFNPNLAAQQVESNLSTALGVFPNPTFKDLNIEIPMTPSRTFKLSVFNTTGIQVLEKDIEAMEGDVIQLDNLDHLSNGIYFIKLIGEDGMTTSSKFILQRE